MDGLQEILFTLRQNKLRTLLTAFGVFWGILMLILLLGAGKGMQNGVKNSFGSDVLDFIVIYTGTTTVSYNGMGVGRYIQLTVDDAQALAQHIPGIKHIATERSAGNADVHYKTKTGSFPIHAIPNSYFDIKLASAPIHFGRKLNPFDQNQVRKVCLLGTTVVERLFGKDADPVGKEITISGFVLKVVGVYYDKGNRGQDSTRIYIPDSTYEKVYGNGNRIQSIWLRPQAPDGNPNTVSIDGFELEKKATALLRKRHDVSPEDTRAVGSFNMAQPARQINGLFIAIHAFIWFVGLGTLTAGIIGISNIMIITVKERTREIGVRKALGATPFNIVVTLLMESIIVTSIAGYVGLVLGVGLLEMVSFALQTSGADLPFFKNPEVDFQVGITAIILLVVVGALAGLAPALQAARIMPVEAMRAE